MQPMSDADRAARYFDEQQAPDMRATGMPDEGLAHLRQRYIRDARDNPEAVRQLREFYPAAERPWCGARKELGGQQPCPLTTPCDGRTCQIGSADGHESY